jgi:hypothetical protein
MNPPFSAAIAVSLGIGGRADFAAILFGDLEDGPVSFKAGGRSVLPVTLLIWARASGVRNENTDFPGRGFSPSNAPRSLGARLV